MNPSGRRDPAVQHGDGQGGRARGRRPGHPSARPQPRRRRRRHLAKRRVSGRERWSADSASESDSLTVNFGRCDNSVNIMAFLALNSRFEHNLRNTRQFIARVTQPCLRIQSLDFIHVSRILQCVPSARRLGFFDLDFECSTVCLALLGLMEIWQKQLGKMVKHRNQSQPNPGLSSLGTPCIIIQYNMLYI